MKVYTISGKATHGKDFTAEILKEMLEENGKRVLILHYADYLKYLCKQIFGWDGVKDDKGRTILQKVGTDLVRTNNPDLWAIVIAETICGLKTEFDSFIIPDCRFENEICIYYDYSIPIYTIHIERLNYKSNLTDEQLNHPSETALNDFEFDYYLEFETGKENVIKAIKESGMLG